MHGIGGCFNVAEDFRFRYCNLRISIKHSSRISYFYKVSWPFLQSVLFFFFCLTINENVFLMELVDSFRMVKEKFVMFVD